jgi:hypothetical protein
MRAIDSRVIDYRRSITAGNRGDVTEGNTRGARGDEHGE